MATAKTKSKTKIEPPSLSVPTTVTVYRTIKIGKTGDAAEASELTETIEVHKFVTEPAYARIFIPLKKAQNFNSAGLSIGVDVPCYKEELGDALEYGYTLATDFMLTKLPKVLEALKKL